MTTPTALIADDEPLLRERLCTLLQRCWPELEVVAQARNGREAVELFDTQSPQVVFLDVHMPGINGIEAARSLARRAQLVFVTAYDQYALQAFEQAAVDYVLKPVQPERLAQTCARLRAALERRSEPQGGATVESALSQLRALLGAPGLVGAAASPAARLNVIQAGVGTAIHMVPVQEVLYFEAADKYVRVITAEREHLIRTSLRELLPQLDPDRFWQVHRGTVVRSDAIASALRDESGKLTLVLRGHGDKLAVSRLYAHRFKPM